MPSTDIRQAVEAPTRTPYRFGLFSVLDFSDTRQGVRLAWDSIGCGPIGTNEDPCLSDVDDLAVTGTVGCENGTSVAFTVTAYDDSSLGRPPRTASPTRVTDQLLLQEQAAVEARITEELFNTGLDVTSATPPGATLPDRLRADLTDVENQLALQGGEGIILVRRGDLHLLPDNFIQTDSMLRTALGTPVAAVGGWGASVPDLTVLGVSAFVADRGSVTESLGYYLDVNSVSKIAQRDYAIGWECQAVFASHL